jgi:hypothetical protein
MLPKNRVLAASVPEALGTAKELRLSQIVAFALILRPCASC